MRVRDRNQEWRDGGPQQARHQTAPDNVGGSGPAEFRHAGPLSEGRCPMCGHRMRERGNEGSCIKLVGTTWQAMRRPRGRGGFVFGQARVAA